MNQSTANRMHSILTINLFIRRNISIVDAIDVRAMDESFVPLFIDKLD